MKKRLLFLILISILCVLTVFSSCAKPGADDGGTDGKKIITVSVFPVYDWVREVSQGSDGVDVRLLIDSGTDMHSYQPSAADILKITKSDLFIFIGGESDEWAQKALENDSSAKTEGLSVTDALKNYLLTEEELPGIEDKHSHSHEEAGETENDEHVWLSLKNAEIFTDIIAEKLALIDPDNSGVYYNNAKEYIKQLSALEDEYRWVVNNSKTDTLIVCDRFPFRYLTNEFSIKYYAAFSGCTSETDASFKTVSFLINKAEEVKTDCLITADGSDKKLARTVASCMEKKDIKILTLDSMQTISKSDIDSGKTYLSVMKNNLKTLSEALNSEEK